MRTNDTLLGHLLLDLASPQNSAETEAFRQPTLCDIVHQVVPLSPELLGKLTAADLFNPRKLREVGVDEDLVGKIQHLLIDQPSSGFKKIE